MLPTAKNFFGTLQRQHIVQSKIDDWFEEAVHQMDDGKYIKVSLSYVEDGGLTKRKFNYVSTTEEYFNTFN
jgi:hypothetical protein